MSGRWKKRKNGSEKNGEDPGPPRIVRAEEMLTTAGITVLATPVHPAGVSPVAIDAEPGSVCTAGGLANRTPGRRPIAAAMSSAPSTSTKTPKDQTCHRRMPFSLSCESAVGQSARDPAPGLDVDVVASHLRQHVVRRGSRVAEPPSAPAAVPTHRRQRGAAH